MPDRGHRPELLIAGAGPTGLAAALFLAGHGLRPRIVERSAERSVHSKALAVNPRSLNLLADTPVRQRLLDQGWRARYGTLHTERGEVGRIELGRSDDPAGFLLIHSQARTEALLEEALAGHGIEVERRCALKYLCSEDDRAHAALESEAAGAFDMTCDAILAADGAHSTARHVAGLDFPGSGYPEPWWLWDLELETPLAADGPHALLLSDGFVFMLPIAGAVWRVISNVTEPLARLPAGTRTGAVSWESEFHISHRMVERMRDGRLFLAGDAAHIHSPIGGRGMNLGIEDAYVFAALAARGELHRYASMREPVDAAFVRQAARVTEMPRGRTWPSRLLRHLGPLANLMPLLASSARARNWVLGTDHPLGL